MLGGKIMNVTLSHVGFLVEDMEASVKFYKDLLGAEEVYTIMDDDGQPWIKHLKICGEVCLELCHCSKTDLKNNVNARRFSHFCFEVDNIDQLIEEVKAKNIEMYIAPKEGKDFSKQFWLKDLDGNKVEFVQYGSKSLHKELSKFCTE